MRKAEDDAELAREEEERQEREAEEASRRQGPTHTHRVVPCATWKTFLVYTEESCRYQTIVLYLYHDVSVCSDGYPWDIFNADCLFPF